MDARGTTSVEEVDILVIGSGIGGLSFALQAAGAGRVALITKKRRADSNTNYAQGGIAAVMGEDDRPALHVRDTLAAGAGLCHADAVAALVEEGPARVRELMAWGARFSGEPGRPALGREGGHSRRRIVHAADATGREIERALLDALAATGAATLYEDRLALDFLVGTDPGTGERRCGGALVLDRHTRDVVEVRAAVTLLASGGLGRVYRHTTNPDIATGDGVAMAYRAGAEVANLEFVQFHPTALYPAEDRAFLISEAVRGEGAVLRRMDGTPLMEGVAGGSLATRDVVARAIDASLKTTADPYVLLDLSAIPPDVVEAHFPMIAAECAARGISLPADPIPVVPAAHYACGGVRTDVHGRSSLAGLYAVGEVACTGVHGANRLASNSLLEALVFSHRAAEKVAGELHVRAVDAAAPSPPRLRGPADPEAEARLAAWADELRGWMWEDAGIVRRDARLARAERRIVRLRRRVEEEYARAPLTASLVELRNLVQTALLIVRSARSRRESRGLHYTTDHPERDDSRCLHDTILRLPGGRAARERAAGG